MVKSGPVLCCKADYFIPPGLFSTLQAVQILKLRKNSPRLFVVPKADSAELHIQIAVNDQQQHNISALIGQKQQINAGQEQEQHQYCLYLQADTLPLLTTLCCDLENIVREMFPGFMCTWFLLFHHADTVYEGYLDSSPSHCEMLDPRTPARWKKVRGGLGFLLSHGLNVQVDAMPVRGKEQLPAIRTLWNVPLHQALRPLTTAQRPFFYVSHSWDGGPTALNTAAERVLGGVVDLLEAVSGQDVLVSTEGVADEDACSGAQAVIVLLSPAYLAGRLSLRELGMALEARLGRGMPLLALTVNPQVHACIMQSYRGWAALGDEWRVAGAALELVRRRIDLGTIRVCRQWEDDSGLATLERWRAVKSIVESVQSSAPGRAFAPHLPPAMRPPRFVVKEGDRPELLEERP